MLDPDSAVAESRPLLGLEEEEGTASNRLASQKNPTPLPWLQLTTIVLVDLCAALSASSMLPYITELISGLDIIGGDTEKVGYFVGLFATFRNVASTISILPLSRLSDRIGRKPVILFGMAASTMSMLCFGLSRTFWGLVMSACFGNLLSFNTGLVKIVVVQITDSTNRALGFALVCTVFSLGGSLSSFIGGGLARPSDRFPDVFTGQFWKQYPYFLPCLVVAVITILSILIVIFSLKETLPRRSSLSRNSEPSSSPTNKNRPAIAIRQILTYPLILVIANYSMYAILYASQDAILPLFFAIPVEHGGLGLDPVHMGYILGSYRACTAFFFIGACSRLIRHFGARRAWSISILCHIFIWMILPIANIFARTDVTFGVWACVAILGLTTACLEMGTVCIYIFITAVTPSQDVLGTINGLAWMAATIASAPGPAMATSLFSLSHERNILGGYFVYVVFLSVSFFTLWLTSTLPTETRPVWEIESEAEELRFL
ncbi:major facilitator superfamily domain-containing protein [Amanita rubescens]|nr:major facilitator superfamily domain-containing protein [Amanita rubescens]